MERTESTSRKRPVLIYFDDAIVDALDRKAHRRGMSRSALVREVCRRALQSRRMRRRRKDN